MGTRLDREKQTIKKMIALYQRQSPQALAEPEHYQALYDYAMKRLEMKQIMRWAGPKMLWRHPVLTIRHLIDDRAPVPPIPEKYRKK